MPVAEPSKASSTEMSLAPWAVTSRSSQKAPHSSRTIRERSQPANLSAAAPRRAPCARGGVLLDSAQMLRHRDQR